MSGSCEPTVNPVPALFYFVFPGSLSPSSGPARVSAFRMTGTSGPSRCANIDKGLTLSLLAKGIGL